jgi:hypothetical protein
MENLDTHLHAVISCLHTTWKTQCEGFTYQRRRCILSPTEVTVDSEMHLCFDGALPTTQTRPCSPPPVFHVM